MLWELIWKLDILKRVGCPFWNVSFCLWWPHSKGRRALWTLPSWCNFSSVQFSHSAVSNSLWPHRLQHSRLRCESPTPRACPSCQTPMDMSNACPSCRWCHPTISSSVIPFSSHLQSVPASGSFQISRIFVVIHTKALA